MVKLDFRPKDHKVQVSVSFREQTLNKVDEIAQENGCPRSQVVMELLEYAMSRPIETHEAV